MSALTLALLLWLSTAPPPASQGALQEVVVEKGETLAQVARRTLGEERGASELRALNGLASDTVAPGTRLKLPGPARARAQSALSAAAAAITGRDAGSVSEALLRLEEAERHFASARYEEAARAADAAWALVSDPSAPVRFSVQVDADAGVTEVASTSGPPLQVEAAGVSRPVYPGQSVRVARGERPAAPPLPARVRLTAPAPVAPARGATLKRPAEADGALAPVTVRWAKVAGASGYQVEVRGARGRTWTVSASGTEASLPPLPPGRYRWRVRAVAGAHRGEASAERTFVLSEEPLELEVRGADWK